MNEQDEKLVIVKSNIPSSLKLQFKVLCIQKELTMSEVLEELIEEWIQADAPVTNFVTKLTEEDYKDVKGSIPKSLKTQFKVFCTRKRVTISSAVYNLIKRWVKAELE